MTQPLRQETAPETTTRETGIPPASDGRSTIPKSTNCRVSRSDDPPYQNWWVIDARTDSVKFEPRNLLSGPTVCGRLNNPLAVQVRTVCGGRSGTYPAASQQSPHVPKSLTPARSSHYCRRRQTQKHRTQQATVRPGQPAIRGWRPADPSFDQQGRRYQPPPGLACPIDLGYGRWGSCMWTTDRKYAPENEKAGPAGRLSLDASSISEISAFFFGRSQP